MRIILLLALAMAAATAVTGRRYGGGGGRGRGLEVTCAQIKPQEVCNGDAALIGFKVSDGCNLCTCGAESDQFACTIKSCPREEELQEPRQRRKASRYCARLARKVQRKLQRYRKRAGSQLAAGTAAPAVAAAGAAGGQRWPIKCFKERKLCRQQPGVAFFDGCNRCRCPQESAAAAQCETVNTCPEFVGSKREFKRHCRSLGARIDGASGGGRRGNRRRQRQDSLIEWLVQRF